MAIITLPRYGEHLAFLGTTGSGKSVLAEQLLNRFENYFAIDTQNSLTLPGSVKITNPKNLSLKLKWYKKIRYVPSPDYMNREAWNFVFYQLSASSSKQKPKPRIVYIDEIYHTGYGASFPQELPKLATTGRQKKLSLWISTQRPSMIPIPLLTECKRLYVFYLKYTEDIKKIGKLARGITLTKELEDIKLDFSFYEINGITGDYKHLAPISLNIN
jgi:hypothetical protein